MGRKRYAAILYLQIVRHGKVVIASVFVGPSPHPPSPPAGHFGVKFPAKACHARNGAQNGENMVRRWLQDGPELASAEPRTVQLWIKMPPGC